MKRLLVALAVVAALAAPVAASAHPLGNFTVNRYSELDVAGNRVYVVYMLDLAEIPTFQAGGRQGIHATAYAARIAANLRLEVDGRRAHLVPLRSELAFPQGQGGLTTTRLEVLFEGPLLSRAAKLRYRDGNYRGRIGWKEVVVSPSAGARLTGSSVPDRSVSDRLLAYPKNLLQSPLNVVSASAAVVPGASPGEPPALASAESLEQRAGVRAVGDSGFARLIVHDDLGAWFVVASLFVAFFWGAGHGLGPGHGKAIVAAYLVGSRGTARHALLLGGTVTVTHTIGVFTLGLVTLSLSQFIVPDTLYPWLNLVSALLIVGVGVSVLRWRVVEWRRARAHQHAHEHGHEHSHDHDHGHSHDAPLSVRGLLGVGVSGGIIPCPTALVVLLAATSLHRVGYGLVLIVAFSIGLAATVSAIGLLAIAAKGAFGRLDLESGVARLLPAVSAVVVLGLGLVMTLRALPNVT